MISIADTCIQKRFIYLCKKIGIESRDSILFKETVGGTNTTFFVQNSSKKYVFRIASNNTKNLGLDRKVEMECTRIASDNSFGLPLLYFNKDTGDMVTKYIEGHTPSNDELYDKRYLCEIACIFRKLHSFNIPHCFNPIEDIVNRNAIICGYEKLACNDNYKKAMSLFQKLKKINAFFEKKYCGLCHNDSNNFNFYISPDQKLYLIDYEYAGMGNVFFDIACLCGLWEKSKQIEFLTEYFGEYNGNYLKYLHMYNVLSLIWNGTWAYVKSVESNFVEIDYVLWANEQFLLAIDTSKNIEDLF